jgi:hypothetical protein
VYANLPVSSAGSLIHSLACHCHCERVQLIDLVATDAIEQAAKVNDRNAARGAARSRRRIDVRFGIACAHGEQHRDAMAGKENQQNEKQNRNVGVST